MINSRITVITSEKDIVIEKNKDDNILEALLKNNIFLPSYCAGRGTCGKCTIIVTDGFIDISSADESFFSSEELKQGYRLACKAYPSGDVTIRLLSGIDNRMLIVEDITDTSVYSEGEENKSSIEGMCGIAIDIGTTTLAASLVDISSESIVKTTSKINHQCSYGADVISRIKMSNEGKHKELTKLIRTDLSMMISEVCRETSISLKCITRIVISGNTTMTHLLLGYPCDSLGVYPFSPYSSDMVKIQSDELFNLEGLNCIVAILPAVSGFVGGDIISGILSCGIAKSDDYSLLIDLGTNGEMALGNKDRILVASTAAGPAFEGGNISCGLASIQGAICSVDIIESGQVIIDTIGGKPPIGLCGTGVLEITSELLNKRIINSAGNYDEEYVDGFEFATCEDGSSLFFTQNDVREVQLAKAAIRSGVEILINQYGISYSDIENVYIAGGFGYFLNIDKAFNIGLIPEEFKPRVTAVGNTSLKGAIACVLRAENYSIIDKIVNVSSDIQLANNKDFNELFIGHMEFRK